VGQVAPSGRIQHVLVEGFMDLFSAGHPPVRPKEERHDRGDEGLRFPPAPPPPTP
jgi:hypothetical protein